MATKSLNVTRTTVIIQGSGMPISKISAIQKETLEFKRHLLFVQKRPGRRTNSRGCFFTCLRRNPDSLKLTQPVSMNKEPEHVRNYLALEKLRFDGKLHMVRAIQSTDFQLPAPAENAVKYGGGKKPEGGTVTIASAKSESSAGAAGSKDTKMRGRSREKW